MVNLSLFAERLNDLMAEANIKSEQLGKNIGVDGSTIRRWRRGDGVVNLTNLVSLSDYFGCAADYLAGRSEVDNNESFTPKPLPPFPLRLREVLQERGLSRYLLDKDTKFKDGYFCQWDKGTAPMLPTLIELADLLDCTIDYLIGRET